MSFSSLIILQARWGVWLDARCRRRRQALVDVKFSCLNYESVTSIGGIRGIIAFEIRVARDAKLLDSISERCDKAEEEVASSSPSGQYLY